MNDHKIVLGSMNDLTDYEDKLVLNIRVPDQAGVGYCIVCTDKYEVYLNDAGGKYEFDLRFLNKEVSVTDALMTLHEIDNIVTEQLLKPDTDISYVCTDIVKAQSDFLAAVGSIYEFKS